MVSNQEEATVVVFTPLSDMQLFILQTTITAATQHGIYNAQQDAFLCPQDVYHSKLLHSKGSACEMHYFRLKQVSV